MKIAVPGHTYSSKDGPVAVILTAEDRALIARMPVDATIYCQAPGHMDAEPIDKWLDTLKEPGDPEFALHLETHLDENGDVSDQPHKVSIEEQRRRLQLFLAKA